MRPSNGTLRLVLPILALHKLCRAKVPESALEVNSSAKTAHSHNVSRMIAGRTVICFDDWRGDAALFEYKAYSESPDENGHPESGDSGKYQQTGKTPGEGYQTSFTSVDGCKPF